MPTGTNKENIPSPPGKPYAKRKGRNNISVTSNLAPALLDTVFEPLREQQTLSPASFCFFKNKENQIQANAATYYDYFTYKLLLFFPLLVVCYDTPYSFKLVGAYDQIDRPDFLGRKTISISDGDSTASIPLNAAHTSSTPHLLATMRNNDDKSPQEWVEYLYGSDFHYANAGTTELCAQLNLIFDRAVEEHGDDGGLRAAAESIVDKTSRRELTPVEGMRQYVAYALQKLESLGPTLKPIYIPVYNAAYNATKELEYRLQDNAFLDGLLGITLTGPNGKKFRKNYLPHVYKHYTYLQEFKSVLATEMESLRNKLLSESETKKAPFAFEQVFKLTLLQKAPENMKTFLRELFCRTEAELYDEILWRKMQIQHGYLVGESVKIRALSKKIIALSSQQTLSPNKKRTQLVSLIETTINQIRESMKQRGILRISSQHRFARVFAIYLLKEIDKSHNVEALNLVSRHYLKKPHDFTSAETELKQEIFEDVTKASSAILSSKYAERSIQNLYRFIRIEKRTFRSIVDINRSGILNTLYFKVLPYSWREIAKRYKALYPNDVMSYSTLHRIKEGQRAMDDPVKMADALGMNESIFLTT